MPTPIEKLLCWSSAELAIKCHEVAENPFTASAAVKEARKLYQEYFRLTAKSAPSYEEQKKIEATREELKQRMAALLAPVL